MYIISIRTSVIFLFLFIGGNKFANGEEKDILFNRKHHRMEDMEAQQKLYDAAIKICPNQTEEVKIKIDVFKNCSSAIEADDKTMCQVVEEVLDSCLPKIIEYYEACVPEKAKNLPTYVMETAQKLAKHVCDNSTGSQLLELANPCVRKTHHNETRQCIKKFRNEVIDKYNHENPPEKDIICIFINDFKSCFEAHVDRFCKDAITRDAFKSFYNVFLCKKK